MNNSLLQLTGIQFKTFFREPGVVFWAIVFPILISWILGIAFSSKGENKATVFVVEQNTIEKSGSLQGLKLPNGNRTFGKDLEIPTDVTFQTASKDQALKALRKGEVSLYISIIKGSLVYHYDPRNAEARSIHLLIDRELSNCSGASLAPVTATGSRYIDFLIPGLIAFGIMNSCLWGISYNLIEYRMKKLLRRMVATPMKKSYFFFSLILARIILSAVETIFLIVFALLFFKISITGSFAALILVYLSGIAVFSGIAILISSRTNNSQVGNGIINAVILPMTILSGVFFNYHNFPDWAINLIHYLPLTLLVDNLRGIFVEGFSLASVLYPSLGMVLAGGIFFLIGLKYYKWY